MRLSCVCVWRRFPPPRAIEDSLNCHMVGKQAPDPQLAVSKRALRPGYLGKGLFYNQPMSKAIRAVGGHFLFTCKPASHPLIRDYITGHVCLSRRTKTEGEICACPMAPSYGKRCAVKFPIRSSAR